MDADPWTVRRVAAAGEARRPSKGAADRVSPLTVTVPSTVALVVRRERTVGVYCKSTNETVPCTAVIVADESFEGMRVVLWRTHADVDVGRAFRVRVRVRPPAVPSPSMAIFGVPVRFSGCLHFCSFGLPWMGCQAQHPPRATRR